MHVELIFQISWHNKTVYLDYIIKILPHSFFTLCKCSAQDCISISISESCTLSMPLVAHSDTKSKNPVESALFVDIIFFNSLTSKYYMRYTGTTIIKFARAN